MDPTTDLSLLEIAGAERELRLASYVERWQIVQRRRAQSIADHQWHVAVLCLRMLDELELADRLGTDVSHASLTAAVLRHALLHDLPEVVTGDLPSPANKAAKRSPEWREWVNNATRQFFPWWGRHRPMIARPLVDHLVGIADLLEAWLHLHEERGMGNEYVVLHQDYVRGKLEEALGLTEPWPASTPAGVPNLVRRWVEKSIANASSAPRVLV